MDRNLRPGPTDELPQRGLVFSRRKKQREMARRCGSCVPRVNDSIRLSKSKSRKAVSIIATRRPRIVRFFRETYFRT